MQPNLVQAMHSKQQKAAASRATNSSVTMVLTLGRDTSKHGAQIYQEGKLCGLSTSSAAQCRRSSMAPPAPPLQNCLAIVGQ
jgi:hypothetical protein